MAKRLKEVLVEDIAGNCLKVYADPNYDIEISKLEGVVSVTRIESKPLVWVYYDPRYDSVELTREIEELCRWEIP